MDLQRRVAALYASANGETTPQDTNAQLRVDPGLDGHTFWFAGLLYDRNLCWSSPARAIP